MCTIFIGIELETIRVSVKVDKGNETRKLASCQMSNTQDVKRESQAYLSIVTWRNREPKLH